MFVQLHKLILTALMATMLTACSNSDEPAEKGRTEQATDKIAKEAVRSIETPIEQANLAKELTEQHNSAVKKNANSVGK
ncbi:hypothetical protein FCL47_21625 [Desulfopila sp. IMCC35006]|uniref:hypothetical protein n=1 Tax=Desulfopila sp. IMCC35006 TaxID=2569542 RepID=UPI0010ABBDB6|nr:hypothetical protein [Desulfopila sp. IMCC35006]TKB23648.1 hypothetical protein FCL47_21625 [Desulfopila sp. IMCC35006]